MTPLTGGPHPARPATAGVGSTAPSVSRIGALAVVAALMAVLGLFTGGSAAATTSTQRTAPATTPAVPVMIVLDASGSMNQTDAPGPRIDAAKAAVTSLIDTLPAQAQVGLQVYGTGTGSTDAEKQAGCTDIKTLAPVAPLNPAALKDQVATVVAAGYTPIGNALRAAAEALPNEGPRSIVLVSDGEDTCAPPAPCDVANELEQQGIDLTIHTVGFKVDPTAREQLSCIAQATGGTYSDAADATALTEAMAIKVDYAVAGYTTVGTPVTGADQASAQAPLLTPGQYVDSFAIGGSGAIDAAGTKKYYTIQAQTGYRPYISATIVPPDATSGAFAEFVGLDASLTNIEQDFCTSERGLSTLLQGQNETATAILDGPTFGDPDNPHDCPTEGVALLTITRIGGAWADRPLPVEIVVRMEPPADASALLPQASTGDPLPAPVHGTPSALTGGTGFNDAPRLSSGATYQDTLATGQSRFYRVPMQWGQRLAYVVTETGPAQPSLGIVGSVARVNVFNPVRSDVTKSSYTAALWFADEPAEPISGSTVYPVRYTNREGVEQRDFSLDGDYYLRVNANRNDDEPSSTTFLITVVTSGTAEAGPVYQVPGAAGTVTGATDSESAKASAATTPATTASVTTADGSSGGSDIAANPTGQATPITGPAVPGWVWAVAALLAAGTVAALLFVRSRRPAAPSTDRDAGDQPGSRHW